MLIKNPSKYQSNIFSTFLNSNSNIVCSAVPGSGKTSTLLHLLELVEDKEDTIFVAFNKSIVEELSIKVPNKVIVSTIHSIGVSSIYYSYKKVKFIENKVIGIVYKLKKNWKIEVKNEGLYLYTICELVNLYRLSLCNNINDLNNISIKYGVLPYSDELERAYDVIKYMQKDYFKSDIVIDYVDMIYIPVFKNLSLKTYKNVFIDECQDLSKCQQELIKKLIKKDGRFVAVGDQNQSIYSFLGADEYSFENLMKQKNTVTLPLSISYRCAKNIISLSNNIYDTIEPESNSEDGEVRYGYLDEVRSGDFVLCRNNLPLFHVLLYFLTNSKKCYIKGKDFEKKLQLLISKLSTESPIQSMKDLLLETSNKLKDKGVKKVSKHKKYIELHENLNIIEVLLNRFGTILEVKKILKQVFNEDNEGIILSTIHKSKGLEADNVFILMHELIPSKYAELDWELEAEKKLLYVAYTRAKKKLIFLKEKF